MNYESLLVIAFSTSWSRDRLVLWRCQTLITLIAGPSDAASPYAGEGDYGFAALAFKGPKTVQICAL